MEMGLWCLPSLISPPFRVRHLTYATSCRTSGPQSSSLGPTNATTWGPQSLHTLSMEEEQQLPRAQACAEALPLAGAAVPRDGLERTISWRATRWSRHHP